MAQGTLPLRAPLRLSSEAFPALQAELVTPPPPGPPVPLSCYHVVSLLSLFGDLKDTDIYRFMRAVLSCFIRVRLFAIPWTVARQAPPSMRLSRQEY